MGTNLKDLLVVKEIDFDFLAGKKLAVDSFNVLYQFLTTIRQRDGTLLKDSQGNVTSHLAGLFSRTTSLMQKDIKLAFVFDGMAPKLKAQERERRIAAKVEAQKKFEEAEKSGDVEEMKKYAARTTRLTKEMIEEAKELISYLGLPVVQAACEGEAQVAYIAKQGDVFAGVSEDYDSLLYGIPRLVKNLTISQKKKMKATYITVKPKMIEIAENLKNLGIDNDGLIALAIIVGTDYNPGGIFGIGPKGALKLVKESKGNYEKMFSEIEKDKKIDFDWKEIFELIKHMPVNKDYKLHWGEINRDKVYELLVEKHEFSAERINKVLDSFEKSDKEKKQKSLFEY